MPLTENQAQEGTHSHQRGGMDDGSSISSGPSSYSLPLTTRKSAEMDEIIRETQRVETSLQHIEQDIMKAEEEYFEKTPHGNVVRGWDGFLDSKPPARRRYEGRERIFTWSSYTFWIKHMGQHEAAAVAPGGDFDDGGGIRRTKSFMGVPTLKESKSMVKTKNRKRKRSDDDDFSV